MLNKNIIPILSVKLKIPEPRKGYVIRKTLFNKLESINNKRVTIIKGGAGSGKTTLLSSYIKENDLNNILWLSIDKSMDSVFIFWKYIIQNSRSLLEEKADEFENSFFNNIQKDNLWNILYEFINILFENEDIIYVLDDFQNIKDEFLISTINFFIKNMPQNIHLVIICRDIPNICLGSLYMENELLLIEDEDLRMSVNESEEFLRKTLSLSLDNVKINSIVQKSNGWVGGLQLMAISLNSRDDELLIDINSSRKVIDEYISNEIYNYLEDSEKEFLLKTSISSYFNKELCDKLYPNTDCSKLIESILNKNLFVISVSSKDNVYRYHSIMKEYLNNIINKDDKIDEIYIEIANIFEELGDYEESINILFEARQYEILMTKLLRIPQNVLKSNYFMKVPIHEIVKNVDFAYQYFFYCFIELDSEVCKKIYQIITNSFQEEKSFDAFKDLNSFFSTSKPYIKHNIIPLKQINSLNLNIITKAYLLILEGYLLYINEENDEAINYLDEAEKVYKQTNNDYIEMLILLEKSMVYEEQGYLSKALALYEKLENFIGENNGMKVSYYIGIVGIYLKQLDIEKAENNLKKAEKYLVKENDSLNIAYLCNYAHFLCIKGNYDKSEEILLKLAKEQKYDKSLCLESLLRYPILRIKRKELCNDFIEDYNKKSGESKNSSTELIFAELIFEDNRREEAIEIVDKLLGQARKKHNVLKIIEGDLLKIRFLIEEENIKSEVIDKFIEAIKYSYKYKIAICIWLKKDIVSKVINIYYEEIYDKLSNDEIRFLNNILDFKGKESIDSNKYNLTDREKEVLYEMEKGLSNKEIGEKLSISLSTVKSHIINIYSKLNVNNRVAAIKKYEII